MGEISRDGGSAGTRARARTCEPTHAHGDMSSPRSGPAKQNRQLELSSQIMHSLAASASRQSRDPLEQHVRTDARFASSSSSSSKSKHSFALRERSRSFQSTMPAATNACGSMTRAKDARAARWERERRKARETRKGRSAFFSREPASGPRARDVRRARSTMSNGNGRETRAGARSRLRDGGRGAAKRARTSAFENPTHDVWEKNNLVGIANLSFSRMRRPPTLFTDYVPIRVKCHATLAGDFAVFGANVFTVQSHTHVSARYVVATVSASRHVHALAPEETVAAPIHPPPQRAPDSLLPHVSLTSL